jgi:hypothetical protein
METTDDRHSAPAPGPRWFVADRGNEEPSICIVGDPHVCVAVCCALADGEALHNATRIVTAVNTHDALVAALREAGTYLWEQRHALDSGYLVVAEQVRDALDLVDAT